MNVVLRIQNRALCLASNQATASTSGVYPVYLAACSPASSSQQWTWIYPNLANDNYKTASLYMRGSSAGIGYMGPRTSSDKRVAAGLSVPRLTWTLDSA